tara:strand:+ start:1460 stop:1777 length:318 start_codon:yes stop_codon:yes gene_type:complete
MGEPKFKFINYNGTYENVHKFGMGCEVTLAEFLSHTVDFLKGCGYSYVDVIEAVKSDGKIVSSEEYDYSNTLDYEEQKDRLDNWSGLRYEDSDFKVTERKDPYNG